MISRLLPWVALPILPLAASATPWAEIRIDPQHVLGPVSPYLTGACLEDVNHEVYGGLSSQMVFGESFQEPDKGDGVSQCWAPLHRGTAQGGYQLVRDGARVGSQSQRITFAAGSGQIGISNRGLNGQGISFSAHQRYGAELWVRAATAVQLVLGIADRSGRRLQSLRAAIRAGEWQRCLLTFRPEANISRGEVDLALEGPGSIDLSYVFLHPEISGRFADCDVRPDVAAKLLEQGVTVLRYGGSMINAPTYRWKKATGPRWLRPVDRGTWYSASSNRWGIPEFCAFCDAAGILSIPVFNLDESPQDLADFLDYAHSSSQSRWGAQRVRDGHREPFRVHVIELGNEETVNDAYARKFAAIAETLWAREPGLILTVGDFSYTQVITDPFHFSGAAAPVTSLAAHQKILALAKRHGAEVWFDVHLVTKQVSQPADISALVSYYQALQKLAEGAKFRVVTYELNAETHDLDRALANARCINRLERMGFEPVVTSANALQVDGQNDNGWDQGLLFMDPDKVWLQPPGYVCQMLAKNRLDQVVQTDCDEAQLDVTGAASRDGRVVALQVVNLGAAPVEAAIYLPTVSATAEIEELAGDLRDVNTAAAPDRIIPRRRQLQPRRRDHRSYYTFPAHSFTVIRWP